MRDPNQEHEAAAGASTCPVRMAALALGRAAHAIGRGDWRAALGWTRLHGTFAKTAERTAQARPEPVASGVEMAGEEAHGAGAPLAPSEPAPARVHSVHSVHPVFATKSSAGPDPARHSKRAARRRLALAALMAQAP